MHLSLQWMVSAYLIWLPSSNQKGALYVSQWVGKWLLKVVAQVNLNTHFLIHPNSQTIHLPPTTPPTPAFFYLAPVFNPSNASSQDHCHYHHLNQCFHYPHPYQTYPATASTAAPDTTPARALEQLPLIAFLLLFIV